VAPFKMSSIVVLVEDINVILTNVSRHRYFAQFFIHDVKYNQYGTIYCDKKRNYGITSIRLLYFFIYVDPY
jgi:hypothetical protein